MYPYNIDEKLKNSNITSSSAKLAMSADTQTVKDMLIDAIGDEDHDFKYYSILSESIPDPVDSETVKSISFDEYKHKRLLEEIYYALIKEMPPKPITSIDPISDNLTEEFTNSFFKELEGVEMYRELMSAFENMSVRDILFEIITDEQSHADIMNYLIGKSNKK